MKKLYFLCLTLIISSLSFGQTSDLFFSMYGEGSSNNKFLEIYNGTGADVDLSNYSLSSCSNGCNTANQFDFPDNVTFAPGTMLLDGDVYVIAHPSADPLILAEADTTFTFLSNGDDAFALTLAGATADTYTIIDLLGDLSDVDGTGWDVAGVTNGTTNHTLTRKTSVCDPNPNELGSFGTDAANSEWIVGDSNSGWDTLGAYTGCTTSPVVTITAPGDGSSVPSGTTSVDVVFNAENAPIGSTFDITIITNGGAPVTTSGVSSPFIITPTADGDTYTVTVELVDGGVLASSTTNFDIAYPCDLLVGAIVETCDLITPGSTDTYNVTIDFTDGGTTTYTIDTGGIGTVGGDDPTSVVAGTITITDIPENTDFVVTFTGDPANSSCDFTRNINSPDCNPLLTLPLYEGFDYTVGSQLIDDPKWENASDGSDEVLIGGPGGLTYPNFASTAQTGNHVTFDGTGSDPAIDFTPVDSGNTLYASFLINVTDNIAATTAGYFAVLGTFDARLWIVPIAPPSELGGVGQQFQIGISNANTIPSGAGLDPTVLTTGTTILVVMSYNTTDGVMNAWVNPSDTTFGGTAPAANASDTDGSPEASLNQFVIRQDSATETPFILFDELRLGTSWADVTPTTLTTEEFTADSFKVYPNPTSTGFVNITGTNTDDVSVAVFDILGKQVISETLTNDRLNVSTLNAGVYILKISQNNASVTKKLVIK